MATNMAEKRQDDDVNHELDDSLIFQAQQQKPLVILRVKRRRDAPSPLTDSLRLHPSLFPPSILSSSSTSKRIKHNSHYQQESVRGRSVKLNSRKDPDVDAMLSNLMTQSTYVSKMHSSSTTTTTTTSQQQEAVYKDDGPGLNNMNPVENSKNDKSSEEGGVILFKRFDGNTAPSPNHKKRAIQIVECQLIDNGVNTDNVNNNGSTMPRKRRKIQLRMVEVVDEKAPPSLCASTSNKKELSNIVSSTSSSLKTRVQNKSRRIKSASAKKRSKTFILDPLTRIIDTALVDCFQQHTIQPILHILLDNESVIVSNYPDLNARLNKVLSHKCSNASAANGQHNTALHAAALFNDADGLTRILNTTLNSSSITLSQSLDTLNEDGYTALELAKVLGHVHVMALLRDAANRNHHDSSFSNTDNHTTTNTTICKPCSNLSDSYGAIVDNEEEEEVDRNDYVYDVFCCEEKENFDVSNHVTVEAAAAAAAAMNNSTNVTKNKDSPHPEDEVNDGDDDVVIDFQGGVGYYNEHGELVLETNNFSSAVMDADGNNSDSDDSDHDSNDEMYGGNDYPDDEEDDKDEPWYPSSEDDNDDDNDNCSKRRMDATSTHNSYLQKNDLTDEYDIDTNNEYSGFFGGNTTGGTSDNFMYGSQPNDEQEQQRLYAYDEELEDSDEVAYFND